MKNLYFFLLLFAGILHPVLIFSAGSIQSTDCSNASYEEHNGLLIVEIESEAPAAGWELKTSKDGYAGTGYYQWVGSNHFNNPGIGTLNYKIRINNPGEYRFLWRSMIAIGSDGTEHNDSWLRIPDAADFYGKKDGDIIHPKGVCTNDCPYGSGSDGWFKIFRNNPTGSFGWATNTSDDDNYQIYAQFDTAGVYTVEISGRSTGHAIDRFVLFNNTVSYGTATDISYAQTNCSGIENKYYWVNWKVKDESGDPMEGVKINFGVQTAYTDQDGDASVYYTSGEPVIYTVEKFPPKHIITDTLEVNSAMNIEHTMTELPKYELVVSNGSGSGFYYPTELVRIEVDDLEPGQVFKKWVVNPDTIISSVGGGIILINIPWGDVTVEGVIEQVPVGVKEWVSADYKVFPNPVRGDVFIIEANFGIKQLDIIDLKGVIVKSMNGNGVKQLSLDVSELHPGIYAIKSNRELVSVFIRE